jgi:hypothetical protein
MRVTMPAPPPLRRRQRIAFPTATTAGETMGARRALRRCAVVLMGGVGLLAACSSSGGDEGLTDLDEASEALGSAGIGCAFTPSASAAELAELDADDEAAPGSLLEAGFCLVDRATVTLVVVDGPASATKVAIARQRDACEEPGDDVTLVRGYNWVASIRPAARGLGRTLATALDGTALETACAEERPIPVRRLPVGESAELGAFDVRVTEVNIDAKDEVAALVPSIGDPSYQWVLITYEATNVAGASAVPYELLTPSVLALDGDTAYAPGPCGRQASPKEPVEVGDTATLVDCFDLPDEVIEAGTVRIVGRDSAQWRLTRPR